jgi:SAM-dependent methyltransferase
LLDIGCGTADILDHLDPAVRYFGYDMSSAYIGYATSKYQHRQATFECARVNLMSVKELPKMDVVVATGLIHHLDVDEVGALLEIARAALKPSGRFISIDPCYSAGQSRVAKWLIDKDRGEFVRDQLEYKQLGERVFPNIESVVLQRSWVPYTHHIMVCSA